MKSLNFCLFLFYNVYEEKMFTIEIEDSLVSYIQHETNQNVEYVEL